jgi:hypothetical protein
MTFTPFILFFILLFVLVISSLFAKSILSVEGFQEGNSNMRITTSLQSMSLPQYSTQHNVYQLYDSLFFDETNANIIEVSTTLNVPDPANVGNSISQSATIVTGRDGFQTVTYISQYTTTIVPQDVNMSLVDTIDDSYSSWNYYTQTVPPANSYCLFYMPWGKNTYIHVVDSASNENLVTVLFSPDNPPKSIYYQIGNKVGLTSFVLDSDITNHSMVAEQLYNTTRQVYQISHYVKYDVLNGNLILKNTEGPQKTFTVYDINKNASVINATNQTAISNNASTLPNVNFQPYTIVDTLGQNLILYIPNNQTVLIAIISYADAALNQYVLKSVSRFNANGIDHGNQIYDSYAAGQYYPNGPGLGLSPDASGMNNAISEYYKWYWYWNTVGVPGQGTGQGVPGQGVPGHPGQGAHVQNAPPNINDYILKTQIVPPVCPTCPNCPSVGAGTCTNCGGQGGSGTVMNEPNIGDDLADVAEAGADVVTGVAGAGADVVTGVAGAGADVITGVAGTIGGVANNAISTVGSVLQSNPTDVSQNEDELNQRSTTYISPGSGTQGTQATSVNDPYSYYGQLPARGRANFIPITADFSSFSK